MEGIAIPGVIIVDLAKRMGGTETRVLETAIALRARNVSVTVVCLAGSPIASACADRGLRVVLVAKEKWDPRAVLSMRTVLAEHPGWVVDSHNAQSQLLVLLAGAGRAGQGARVATVHSEYRLSEPRRIGLSWHEHVLRTCVRSNWVLVAVSTNVHDYLTQLGADPERVQLIWSGLTSRGPTRSREVVRDELGLGEQDFVVTAVGRLVAVKNLQLLIRAVAGIAEQRPELRLVVVGDGPCRSEWEQMAHALIGAPQVRFIGHRTDVTDLLAASDLLAITSTTEGLPYVLIEAASVGTPVLSTSVGAIPHAFAGDTVALLPVGVQAQPIGEYVLADEIEGLIQDPTRRLGLAIRAQEVQQSRFSVESMLEGTLHAYETAAR